MKNITPKGLLRGISLAVLVAFGATGAFAAQNLFLKDGIVWKVTSNKVAPEKIASCYKNGAPLTANMIEEFTIPEHYTGDIVLPETVEFNGKTYPVTGMGTAFAGEPITSFVSLIDVKTVPNGAFKNCTELKTIVIPGVETLNQQCFMNTGLEEYTVPAKVTKLASNQLSSCRNLKKLIFEETDTEIEFTAGAINYSDADNVQLQDILEEVVLNRPIKNDKITAMLDKPFRGAKGLKKVTFGPKYNASLSPSFFESCKNLEEVVMLNNFTDLGTACFAGTAIKTFDFPAAVTTVPSSFFAGTTKLQTVNFTGGLTMIDALAFQNSAIAAINFPATLTTIGDMAFSGAKLAGEITLPAGVKKVGAQAFAACPLTKVNLSAALNNLGDGAFMGCNDLAAYSLDAANEAYAVDATGAYITDKAAETLISVAPKSTITELYLSTVKTIKAYAAYGAANLATISFPAAENYGNYAFAGTGIKEATVAGLAGRYVYANCPNLEKLTVKCAEVPFGIVAGCPKVSDVTVDPYTTVVKQEAFANTPALKSLNLGSVLAIIEADAFDGCAVENITVAANFPASMPEGKVFTAANSNITVTVPADVAAAYKAANGWKELNIVGDANLAIGGADMGMPNGLYYAGIDGLLYRLDDEGNIDSFDVGGVPHTLQLIEYSHRIYGASAGKKFIYSATGATDGDGKLFYISKVGGNVFQAVVLDNEGGNAYKDPFGLYLFNDVLYVNDRNVCIRKISPEAIALPQNYESWMENNWMAFYGLVWSYGCIKAGFAITAAPEDANIPEYWVGMKYNGAGIFRFREDNIGSSAGAGPLSGLKSFLNPLDPILTTFNIDEKNGDMYIYIEKAANYQWRGGLYRIKLADLEANADTDDWTKLNAQLIDGAPVYWEGGGETEHLGITQLAFDEDGEYMYWCYRAPTAAQVELTESVDNDFTGANEGYKGHYAWAEKFDATNPLHQSGIKRIKLGEANPTVEMVKAGVEGYGIVPVKYGKPEDGIANAKLESSRLISVENGVITAAAAVTVDVYNAAGMIVARVNLGAGESYTAAAGMHIAVATDGASQQALKVIR